MGRVLFFPLIYWPGMDKLRELQRLRDEINSWKARMHNDCMSMGYMDAARHKEAFHQRFRDTWKLIPGEKKNESITTGGEIRCSMGR